MKLAAVVFLLAATAIAGCGGRPFPEDVGPGTCPDPELSDVRVEAEGRPLRHALLVAGPVYRPSLSCAAPDWRSDLPAVGGVASGKAGRYEFREVRLFFDDGTLRLGVELPMAPSHNLTVRMGPPPTMEDDGVPVPVNRTEWLQGPEAGADTFHNTGFVPLRTHDETMALTVASPWNEWLLVQAAVSYEPWTPDTLADQGGRVRAVVTAPNGTVVADRVAAEPDGDFAIHLGPDVPAGVWLVRFEHTASARTHPQMLDSVSAWVQY